jgi:putative nucleotidyltransferase with HDIG domain
MPTTQETKVNNLISSIDNLPTPPVVYSRINESISNPNSSAYQIASIIAEDPAMSAKILRLSNSAFYGTRAEISSVKQAIITIGLEAIKSLVLSTSVFSAFKAKPEHAHFQEEFWRHSLATASASRVLMRQANSDWIQNGDKVFSAGMLHDIGKLVMISYLPNEWAKLQKEKENSNEPMLQIERKLLGYTHTDLGIALADKWHLPELIKDSIAFHHEPTMSPLKDSLAPLVYCGNFMSEFIFKGEDEGEIEIDNECTDVLVTLNIAIEKLQGIKSRLIEEYSKSEIFLSISKGL